MTKTYCDRCAAEISTNENLYVITIPNNDYDLCGACVTDVRTFIENADAAV